MDIRYSVNQRDFKRYTTDEIRDEFLITDLFKADEVTAVYSHVDRMVTLGCMPVNETVSIDKGIDCWKNFGTHYFLERREIGIFNIGEPGVITADGVEYKMGHKIACISRWGQRKSPLRVMMPHIRQNSIWSARRRISRAKRLLSQFRMRTSVRWAI